MNPPNRNETALRFLDKVQARFVNQPQVFANFKRHLQAFNHQEIDIEQLFASVSQLFYGHDDLLVEFNQFLPNGYEIAIPQHFDKAISFLGLIKARLVNQPELYHQFVSLLKSYSPYSDTVGAILEKIPILFKDYPDLLEEFRQFLPHAHPAQASYPPILPAGFQTIPDPNGQYHPVQELPVGISGPNHSHFLNPINGETFRQIRTRSFHAHHELCTIQCLFFFKYLYATLHLKTYLKLIKVLQLYDFQIISSVEIVTLVEKLVGRVHSEWVQLFNTLINQLESLLSSDNSRKQNGNPHVNGLKRPKQEEFTIPISSPLSNRSSLFLLACQPIRQDYIHGRIKKPKIIPKKNINSRKQLEKVISTPDAKTTFSIPTTPSFPFQSGCDLESRKIKSLQTSQSDDQNKNSSKPGRKPGKRGRKKKTWAQQELLVLPPEQLNLTLLEKIPDNTSYRKLPPGYIEKWRLSSGMSPIDRIVMNDQVVSTPSQANFDHILVIGNSGNQIIQSKNLHAENIFTLEEHRYEHDMAIRVNESTMRILHQMIHKVRSFPEKVQPYIRLYPKENVVRAVLEQAVANAVANQNQTRFHATVCEKTQSLLLEKKYRQILTRFHQDTLALNASDRDRLHIFAFPESERGRISLPQFSTPGLESAWRLEKTEYHILSPLGTIHLKSIARVFRKRANEVVRWLYQKPWVALSVILHALEAKQNQWLQLRDLWNTQWRNDDLRHYRKALDYQFEFSRKSLHFTTPQIVDSLEFLNDRLFSTNVQTFSRKTRSYSPIEDVIPQAILDSQHFKDLINNLINTVHFQNYTCYDMFQGDIAKIYLEWMDTRFSKIFPTETLARQASIVWKLFFSSFLMGNQVGLDDSFLIKGEHDLNQKSQTSSSNSRKEKFPVFAFHPKPSQTSSFPSNQLSFLANQNLFVFFSIALRQYSMFITFFQLCGRYAVTQPRKFGHKRFLAIAPSSPTNSFPNNSNSAQSSFNPQPNQSFSDYFSQRLDVMRESPPDRGLKPDIHLNKDELSDESESEDTEEGSTKSKSVSDTNPDDFISPPAKRKRGMKKVSKSSLNTSFTKERISVVPEKSSNSSSSSSLASIPQYKPTSILGSLSSDSINNDPLMIRVSPVLPLHLYSRFTSTEPKMFTDSLEDLEDLYPSHVFSKSASKSDNAPLEFHLAELSTDIDILLHESEKPKHILQKIIQKRGDFQVNYRFKKCKSEYFDVLDSVLNGESTQKYDTFIANHFPVEAYRIQPFFNGLNALQKSLSNILSDPQSLSLLFLLDQFQKSQLENSFSSFSRRCNQFISSLDQQTIPTDQNTQSLSLFTPPDSQPTFNTLSAFDWTPKMLEADSIDELPIKPNSIQHYQFFVAKHNLQGQMYRFAISKDPKVFRLTGENGSLDSESIKFLNSSPLIPDMFKNQYRSESLFVHYESHKPGTPIDFTRLKEFGSVFVSQFTKQTLDAQLFKDILERLH